LAGAKAAKQAVEAAVKKIPLAQYAENNKELKEAMEKWK
jgi:ribulose 1,5-bisphosphate carboxylase large subunit-like protein